MGKKAKFQNAKKTPNWMVDDFHVLPGDSVTWDGAQFESDFIVWFRRDQNPLVVDPKFGNEYHSVDRKVEAKVRGPYGDIVKGATFRYCILLTDETNKDVVVGEKSPPEMIID